MTCDFQRAAGGGIAVITVVLNGLTRAGRKAANCLVMPDGISVRYKGSIYVCIWNEWMLCIKPGGTAEVEIMLLSQ